MSYPWFRLYTEAVDDEKLRLLAFEDRWHYIAILCCKGKGIIDEDNKDLAKRKVAVKMGIDMRTMDEVVRRLAEVGLIDGDTLQPLAWNRRQFDSDFDPTRNERKQRYLQKKKQGTHEERMRNASGTQKERAQEEDTEADADTDTEAESLKQAVVGEKEERSASQAPPRIALAPSSPSSKAKPVPKAIIAPDWIPADNTYALLQRQGIDRTFVDSCIDEFRLYWTERQEARPGWESTFVNNVKRSWEHQAITMPPRNGQRPPLSSIPLSPRAAEFDAILRNLNSTQPVIEGECTHEIH